MTEYWKKNATTWAIAILTGLFGYGVKWADRYFTAINTRATVQDAKIDAVNTKIDALRHDYDVQVERRDKQNEEMKGDINALDSRVGDQDKEQDNTRERVLVLQEDVRLKLK